MTTGHSQLCLSPFRFVTGPFQVIICHWLLTASQFYPRLFPAHFAPIHTTGRGMLQRDPLVSEPFSLLLSLVLAYSHQHLNFSPSFPISLGVPRFNQKFLIAPIPASLTPRSCYLSLEEKAIPVLTVSDSRNNEPISQTQMSLSSDPDREGSSS